HVITLNKTRNRMPRWLSEGISVYEERQRNPAWGQTMTPVFREMTLGDDLTPVSELSAAFLSPKSSTHLSFAYYESSLVVEFLIERYGFPALLKILEDLAAGVAINPAIERRTDSLDLIETEFADFARSRANALGNHPDGPVDWSSPTLTDTRPETLQQYLQDHPLNYNALMLQAKSLLEQERWTDARPVLEQLVRLYPTATGSQAPARQLISVLNKLNDVEAERELLTTYCQQDAAAPFSYRRLAELEASRKNWEAVRLNAERELAVNPLTPAPHLHLALAAEQTGHLPQALKALQSALALNAVDAALLHYRSARLLQQQGDLAAARRSVLKSLEVAPRYRDAQKLLLELVENTPAPTAAP
ncbi:MAG: tetratricopeptide repeat protein, partial [Planctomycetaceae bacterium]